MARGYQFPNSSPKPITGRRGIRYHYTLIVRSDLRPETISAETFGNFIRVPTGPGRSSWGFVSESGRDKFAEIYKEFLMPASR